MFLVVEIAHTETASPFVHLEAGRTLAVVFGFSVLLTRGASGDDGGPLEEVVIESSFGLRIEMALIGGLCKDRYIFIASEFLQISDVRHDNFIR